MIFSQSLLPSLTKILDYRLMANLLNPLNLSLVLLNPLKLSLVHWVTLVKEEMTRN
jgi:hypothetical protein